MASAMMPLCNPSKSITREGFSYEGACRRSTSAERFDSAFRLYHSRFTAVAGIQCMKAYFAALLVLPLAACSWGIKLDSAGNKIRVAWNDDVSACRDLGKITVSVWNSVGPIDRRKTKVNDELEIMARNEGASMGADTIKPLAEPRDGEQSWGAYSCAGNGRAQTPRDGVRPGERVQTFPIKER